MLLTKDIFEIDCENCGNTRILRDGSPQVSPLKSPLSAKLPPKQLLSPNKFEECKRGTLEKSNSLNESKQLRTTKSLSPRAPIKHQTALDESTPSVVVSTVEDAPKKSTKKDSKALKVDVDNEREKNRSTGCLVYVPSDPWTKMDSNEIPKQAPKKGAKRMNKLMDVKSLSKPDLVDSNENDPWVRLDGATTAPRKNAKSATYRQSKSLHIDSKSSTARPRLQRSKSPLPPDRDPLSSLSPTLGYHLVPTEKNSSSRQSKRNQQFLNVSNPNLLHQSRHSFSTSPTSPSNDTNSCGNRRDDELTLNIRRLSEQIKYSSTYASYGNFQTTSTASGINNVKYNESGSGMEKSASLLSDSLLETTC